MAKARRKRANTALGAAHYDKVFGRPGNAYEKPWHRRAASSATLYPALLMAKPPILDVGCGAGHLAAMASVFRVPYLAGVDFSKKAVGLARKHAPKGCFVVADITKKLKIYASARYRTAVFAEVLEHVADDLKVLALIPVGKRVVVSVPSFNCVGHVRWFKTGAAVRKRYGGLVNIDTFVVERRGSHRWYILGGTRR